MFSQSIILRLFFMFLSLLAFFVNFGMCLVVVVVVVVVVVFTYFCLQGYWASEASPTLGCSIEISRDIYQRAR